MHADDPNEVLQVASLPIAKEGQMTVTGADGLDYIVVSHYSDKAGWYVVGTAPVHELIKDTQVIRALLGWIVAAATVFAVLLSVLVARSMGGPLASCRRS